IHYLAIPIPIRLVRDRPHKLSACCYSLACQRIHIVDIDVDHHRRAPERLWTQKLKLGILVGHHDGSVTDLDFSVADPAIGHRNAGQFDRSKRFLIELDGRRRVRYAYIWGHCLTNLSAYFRFAAHRSSLNTSCSCWSLPGSCGWLWLLLQLSPDARMNSVCTYLQNPLAPSRHARRTALNLRAFEVHSIPENPPNPLHPRSIPMSFSHPRVRGKRHLCRLWRGRELQNTIRRILTVPQASRTHKHRSRPQRIPNRPIVGKRSYLHLALKNMKQFVGSCMSLPGRQPRESAGIQSTLIQRSEPRERRAGFFACGVRADYKLWDAAERSANIPSYQFWPARLRLRSRRLPEPFRRRCLIGRRSSSSS